MEREKWMEMAIQLALDNVTKGHGGPFGAVVVKDGKVIGVGRNEVTANNDPTAHAEIQAIREACSHLGDFQLAGCEIYTSCEPCPMCIGAIYWSRPKAVYYACSKEDAARIGFDDHFIYQQLALPFAERSVEMKKIYPETSSLPFQAWESTQNKIIY
ncbi:nucleoside deaminase [Ammoniphilus resinae]|uniref:Guanine deaminase n=1 Tax=Ammoniphilus resinae TaxID=861532 RepID=A0ABS4GL57_9BACL|nr:nucleoside deaminase [Ammoniphilus resinae]MBP1930991.1 guanine deaminase [Ammoniphilus resinae]